MKQICRRTLPSPSQDRHSEVSGLYGITAKWLRTRVGNACIDTHRDTQIDTHTHTHTHTRTPETKAKHTNMHRSLFRRGFGSRFSCSLSAYRLMLVMVVRTQMRIPNRAEIRTQTLPHYINIDILSLQLFQHLELSPTTVSPLSQPNPTPPQLSRRNPHLSSKQPLPHA